MAGTKKTIVNTKQPPTASVERQTRLQKRKGKRIGELFVGSLLDDYGLNPTEFRLLAHIARRANEGGVSQSTCYASVKSMSTCTRLSERTVRHTLQILEKVGLIVKVSQGRARIPGFYRLQNEAEWIDPSLLPEIRKNCSY